MKHYFKNEDDFVELNIAKLKVPGKEIFKEQQSRHCISPLVIICFLLINFTEKEIPLLRLFKCHRMTNVHMCIFC